jgi:hypothetical protein
MLNAPENKKKIKVCPAMVVLLVFISYRSLNIGTYLVVF